MITFVALAIVEGAVIKNLPSTTGYQQRYGEVAFTALIGFLAASIIYIPLGLLADRALGCFYRLDPTLRQRRDNHA